jgi:hypothetical protein
MIFSLERKLKPKFFFSIYCNTMKDPLDYEIKTTRARGKDKAKNRYNRNGGFSSKHLRLKQLEREKKTSINAM